MVENGLIFCLVGSTLQSRLLVVLEARTEPLRAIVEGVSKWLVLTVEVITSHKDLRPVNMQQIRCLEHSLTLSNAVEHDRGWVTTKMGFEAMLGGFGNMTGQRDVF